MRYPNLRLVTGPSEDATVLFDLCDEDAAAPRWVLADGFSLGAPELEGDPDAVDPLYGPRTIEATLEVQGTKSEALGLLSNLARVLVTGYTGSFVPGLWLRVEVEPELAPIWFRLLRPDLAALSWENIYTREGAPADRWAVDLDLPAEAFGYGTQETIATEIVGNDPTAASDGCRFDLPAIKGDSPAPLRVEMVAQQNIFSLGRQGMLISHAATVACNPSAVSSSSGTALTDTSTTSESTSIGGNHLTISFATNLNMVTRLSVLPGVFPGKYKVLARVRWTSSAAQHKVRVTLDGMAGEVVSLTDPAGSSSGWVWADLGDFNLPKRTPSSPSDLGANSSSVSFEFAASAAVAAPLDVDHFILVPLRLKDTVSYRVLSAYTTEDTGRTQVVNGDTEDTWSHVTSTGNIFGQAPYQLAFGVFPQVVPGVTNRLWLINSLMVSDTGGIGGNVKTNTTAVTCRYYPRYLNPPGA